MFFSDTRTIIAPNDAALTSESIPLPVTALPLLLHLPIHQSHPTLLKHDQQMQYVVFINGGCCSMTPQRSGLVAPCFSLSFTFTIYSFSLKRCNDAQYTPILLRGGVRITNRSTVVRP